MAAINNFSLSEFSADVKSQLNITSQDSNVSVDAKIQEYYQNLAKGDGGENAEEFEATSYEYSSAVENCVDTVTEFVKNSAQKFMEFVAGDSKTKKNGALTPDTVNHYENGQITRVTTGFDDNDSKTLEGSEVWTEFIAGNAATKQNGALTPDVETMYDEQGNVVWTREGFDENGNHQIDPGEVWE